MKRAEIMLCYPFEERRLKSWKPPYILQPKLDGDRCRAVIDGAGSVRLYSSEVNEIKSVPHINAALEHLRLHNIELDGELYLHGAPHSWINGVVSREVNIHPEYKLVEFHVFDLVTDLPQVQRIDQLLDTIPLRKTGITSSPIQLVPNFIVHNLEDIMRQQEWFAMKGYEGFIVRDAYAPYVRRRSTQIMKFKPRKEDIYEIVGYAEEISIEGKPKGSLGALRCTGTDGTEFSVGTGPALTREARETLWQSREALPGRYARVKYQHLTHAAGVPRFPVLVEVIDNI